MSDHLKLRTKEVEFRGEKYVLQSLRHGDLLNVIDEARAWVKEDPSLDRKAAYIYCSISHVVISPKFTSRELREGDAEIVNFLKNQVGDFTFLSLEKVSEIMMSQDDLSDAIEQVEKEFRRID
jgi:hypothetical protein